MTLNEMCNELQIVVHPTGCLHCWHAGENNTRVLSVFIQAHEQCPADDGKSWRACFSGTNFTSFEMDFYTVDTMYNFIRMMVRAWEEAVQYIEE